MAVKISPKFELVIPADVRRALNLRHDSRVEVFAKDGLARIVPCREFAALKVDLSDDEVKTTRDKRDRKV